MRNARPTLSRQAYELTGKTVWVAGHRGMVGSALVRRFASERCELVAASRDEVDLTRQSQVEAWLADARPQIVFVAAARVGGILANDASPAAFIYENLAIETNVIHACWKAGVERLVFLGSSCIYPKHAPQPIKEESLLSGPLEPTNQWYAVAKIAGIKLCEAYHRQYGADFISAIPTNLYGPFDNFDLDTGHVAAALLVKTHRAKTSGLAQIELWGSGKPLREFMHVDDLADALVFLALNYSGEAPINVGSAEEISIIGLARLIGEIVGWHGQFVFDPSKPDGTPRKLMDSGRLRDLGWRPRIGLREGLATTYEWFLQHHARRLADAT